MKNFLFDLDSELLTARSDIEKAEAMLAEVCEEYFSIPGENNPHTPQGQSNIISGFEQNRIIAEIAREYAVQTRQTLNTVAAMIKRESENAEPTYTNSALVRAGAALALSGTTGMENAIALLVKYGILDISKLTPEQHLALSSDLEAALSEVSA